MKAEAKYIANYRSSASPFNCPNIRGCRAIYVSLKKKQNPRLADKKFWAKIQNKLSTEQLKKINYSFFVFTLEKN